MKRGTIAAVLIFVIMLGATLLYTRNTQSTPTESAWTLVATEGYLVELTEADIQQVTLTNQVGTVIVGRGADGLWTLIEPVNPAIDLGTMEMRITGLLNLEIQQEIKPEPADTATGLDHPQASLEIVMKDKSVHKYLVGAANPLGDGYYARAVDGKLVLLNQASVQDVLDLITASYTAATPTLAPVTDSSTSTPEPVSP
jgi:hypothetical protein